LSFRNVGSDTLSSRQASQASTSNGSSSDFRIGFPHSLHFLESTISKLIAGEVILPIGLASNGRIPVVSSTFVEYKA
jgi:hypothetical protein